MDSICKESYTYIKSNQGFKDGELVMLNNCTESLNRHKQDNKCLIKGLLEAK